MQSQDHNIVLVPMTTPRAYTPSYDVTAVDRTEPSTFKARTLTSTIIPRVDFDPRNPEHREAYRFFLERGRWGETRFHVYPPFSNVVSMVEHELARYAVMS
jgi:hypothetical protein